MKILRKRIRLLPENAVYTGMFDLIRGIFILGMFFLHSLNNYFSIPEVTETTGPAARIGLYLFNLLGTPQVPMLFMICGYGWRRKTMAKALRSQAASLLPPYLAVPAIIAVLAVIKKLVMGGDLMQDLEYNVLCFLFGYPSSSIPFLGLDMAFIGPLWFVVCYFFASLLLNALLWIDEGWIRWLAAMLLSCVGILFKDTNTVWFLQQSLICVGFMYVGWEMKKQSFLKKDVPLYFLIAVIGMTLWMSAVGRVDVVQHIWKTGMMDVINAMLLGVLMLLLLLRLNCAAKGAIANGLRWLGRRIFPICCIHTVVFFVFGTAIWRDFFTNAPLLGIVIEIALNLAISAAVIALIEAVQKRIRRKKAAE